MKVWTVANHKGGVSKTTSVINIAYMLAQQGNKVLIIDIDSQGNTSKIYRSDYKRLTPNSAAIFLAKRYNIKQAIYPALHQGSGEEIENLDIVPANADIQEALDKFKSMTRREEFLKRAIENSDIDYDYIIIDCPPSLNEMVTAAVVAADKIILPVVLDGFADDSLFSIFGMMTEALDYESRGEMLRSESGIHLFHSRFKAQTKKNNEAVQSELERLEPFFLKTIVRERADILNAINKSQPVVAYKAKCDSVDDYNSLINEIIGA